MKGTVETLNDDTTQQTPGRPFGTAGCWENNAEVT
jgi:hypothetical protein